jgi:hypothetical protein
MSLHPKRTRAYLCGALTGAFTVVALVARRGGARWPSRVASVAALVCGALSVAYEEAAQRDPATTDAEA